MIKRWGRAGCYVFADWLKPIYVVRMRRHSETVRVLTYLLILIRHLEIDPFGDDTNNFVEITVLFRDLGQQLRARG